MTALRELTFFFAVFIGAVCYDQHQYDSSEFMQTQSQEAEK